MNVYILLFTFLDALGITATKYFFNLGIHPYFFVLITGIGSSGLIFLYLLLTKKITPVFFQTKTIKQSIISGIFISGANILGFLSLKIIPATNYILLFRTSLLMVPVLAWIIIKEPVKPRLFPLASLALIGVWLLAGKTEVIFSFSGYSLALLAALMSSLDFIYQKKAMEKINPDVVAFWRRIISALLVGTLWLFTPNLGKTDGNYTSGLILFSVFFFFISLALIRGLKSKKVADFNLLTSFSPLLVGLIAYLWLGETLNSQQLIGAGLILTTIIVYNLLNKYDSRNNSRQKRVEIS